MRRTTVVTSLAALVTALLVPVASAPPAGAAGTVSPSSGASQVVVGGGDGWSGPATRAHIESAGHVTLAPDGTVFVVAGLTLVKVDPATDRVTPVERYDAAQEHGAVDVALLGSTTFLLTPWGLDRIDGAGARTRLWTGSASAVDVGADGVAWLARDTGVTRVLPDGTSSAVAGTEVMRPRDIAVNATGSTAYVLDGASQRYGIYEVTGEGVGARVAGTGYRDDSLRDGNAATSASMESVGGLSVDGDVITVVSREYRLVASFPIGGVVTVRSSGDYGWDVDSAAGVTVATTAATTASGIVPESVVRLTASGSTRILGADPERQWSPDGVRADDAYTGELRGAAPIDATRLVFVTASGMVREVDADGLLRTRATLPPLRTRGKVAVGPDGTAYVVDDAGHVVRVPSSGAPQTLPLTATASDVAVLPDGRLVVADTAPARVLLANADGSGQSVLATLTGAPSDLGLDGDSVLVADDGLRRVGLDGTVSTLLSGGSPTAALRGHDGIWTGKLHQPDTSAMVLHPGGGLGALRAVFDVGHQAEAAGDGAVLVTQDQEVVRVTDGAAVPEQPGPAVTATPGEGRITLTLDDGNPVYGIVRAKRGTQPPRDPWDGVAAGPSSTVFRVGSELIPPDEQWTFAVFTRFTSSAGSNTSIESYTTASTATAAAMPDTTPPPPPGDPKVSSDHDSIWISWQDPNLWIDPVAIDFDHSVVRYAAGSTPPATPTDGTGIDVGTPGGYQGVAIPGPVRGQQYGVSVFTVDFRGNVSRWSTVVQLDYEPPSPVTDVAVTPSYRFATVAFTPPTDADYDGVAYAIAPGDAVPALPSDPGWQSGSALGISGLAMDTSYTVALWTRDRVGNVSAPVTATFRTRLDATPPGPVTGLVASGGSYSISATWTNPTDADFAGPEPELVDPDTGTVTRCPILNSTRTACTWRIKGDATRTVRVRAKDVNGNLSEAVEAPATSDPDSNGTPTFPDTATWTSVPTSAAVRFTKPGAVDLAALTYALRAAGQPDSATLVSGVVSGWALKSVITQTVPLPDATQTYDLYLYATDLNGNRGVQVVTGVHAGPDPSTRPSMPSAVVVTAPADNVVHVSWRLSPWSAPVTGWVATATSDDGTVRIVQYPGAATSLSFGDLEGRTSWSVRLHAVNDVGDGAWSLPQSVVVGDTTAPLPVAALTSAPAYDTATLRWVNPTAFDFAKVVVLRRDRATGATASVYTGTGTSARATGLVPGRSYDVEVRSYDRLGNVSFPTVLRLSQTAVSESAASSVRYGSAVRVAGGVYLSGRRLSGRWVSLFAQPVGSTTWTRVASQATASTGYYAFSVKPSATVRYRVGYYGGGAVGGSYSAVRTVAVVPVLSNRASRTSLVRGASTTLSTTVWPGHARRGVALQRWNGRAWVTYTWRYLSSTSSAAVTVRPARGYSYYRWYLPAHADHAAALSATLGLHVS